MQKSYPGINNSISEWKGQDIFNFQEELLTKVNAHISEKWFYTHMKSKKDSLPRVDMLNLMSQYAGYLNWEDFKFKNRQQESNFKDQKQKNPNRVFIIVPLLTISVLGLLFIFYQLVSKLEYHFCFHDADTKEPISNGIIEVSLIGKEQPSENILCGPDGCFSLKTHSRTIKFIVKSPYYNSDTVTLNLNKTKRLESVNLQPNNYALMIYYFSRMNVADWKKRRDQLDKMISDNAKIYQVNDTGLAGLELYDKWDFINKLTMPSNGLKNLEILATKYQGDKISLIRFRQKKKE